MAPSRRIGIMGGTFDPLHLGHLVAAEQARADLVLDEVLFVPAGMPWQKAGAVAPAEDRYLMVELATAPNPAFTVSRVEVERPGPTYTVDTLRALRDERPGDELFFITGADAILSILGWKDADECLRLATFVAATRPGYDLAALDGVRDRVRTVDVPGLQISSTDIRARFAAGRPVRYLIPDAVEAFVRKRGLYGAAPAAAVPAAPAAAAAQGRPA